jgi:hypothetical protein
MNDWSIEAISAGGDAFMRFALDFRRAYRDGPHVATRRSIAARGLALQLQKVAQSDGLVAALSVALEKGAVGPSAPWRGACRRGPLGRQTLRWRP